MAYSAILDVMNDPSFFPRCLFLLLPSLLVMFFTINATFYFFFRASRSLNNKVSTAQHEAILAQVFCDEVELVLHFQFVPSFFFSDGYILCILNYTLRK